jgi:hypothetical protein
MSRQVQVEALDRRSREPVLHFEDSFESAVELEGRRDPAGRNLGQPRGHAQGRTHPLKAARKHPAAAERQAEIQSIRRFTRLRQNGSCLEKLFPGHQREPRHARQVRAEALGQPAADPFVSRIFR